MVRQTSRGVTRWIKRLSAVVGAGVLIAMGLLAVTIGGYEAHPHEIGIAAETATNSPTRVPQPATPNFKAPPWRCWYC